MNVGNLIGLFTHLIRYKTCPNGVDKKPHWGYYMLNMKTKTILQTVLEMPEFIRQSESCMDEESKKSFIDYIAQYPLNGDLITGTGGVRKIRWTGDSYKGSGVVLG